MESVIFLLVIFHLINQSIQYIRMVYQDLLYFGGYILFIFLAFRLIFLSNKADPPQQKQPSSPKNTQEIKIKKDTKQNKIQKKVQPRPKVEIKKEEIQKEKTNSKFTTFTLNPIEEDHAACTTFNLNPIEEVHAENQDSKNLKIIEESLELQSQSQKLTLNNQSRILMSDTETLQKKQKQKLRREKEINRLKQVKDHYKIIIAGLQRKLQNHCKLHNESLQSINPYQSIIFQEQDSYSNISQHQGPFQLNVSQINNLKDQLYMHQQILTNLLDEQNQLKDKVRELQSQNKKLLQSSRKTQQKEQPKEDSQILMHMLQNLSNNQPKIEQSPAKAFRLQQNQEDNIANIKNLYESHLIEPERIMSKSTLQLQEGSQPYMAKSTINMMSILEGVLNLGLLGQCRSLNEINKKYVMQQIKKATKKRATDTEIVYNSQQAQKNDILNQIKQESSILFLIKLSNSKKIAIFVQYPIVEQTINSENSDNKNFIVLMDLNKRKSISVNELVKYSETALVFGKEEIIINRSKPLSLSSKGTGNIITLAHPIQQLIDHCDKSIGISLLQIYSLIFQE